MANIAAQRIQREYKEVVKSEEVAASGVQLALVNDDFTELLGTIKGPPETPYEGGTYQLEIKVSVIHNYRFSFPLSSYCILLTAYRFPTRTRSTLRRSAS